MDDNGTKEQSSYLGFCMKAAPIIFQFMLVFAYIYGGYSMAGMSQESAEKFSEGLIRLETSINRFSGSGGKLVDDEELLSGGADYEGIDHSGHGFSNSAGPFGPTRSNRPALGPLDGSKYDKKSNFMDKVAKPIPREKKEADGEVACVDKNIGAEDLIFGKTGFVVCSNSDNVELKRVATTAAELADTTLDDFLLILANKNYSWFNRMSDSNIGGIPLPHGYKWEKMNELQRRTLCAVAGLVEAAFFDSDDSASTMYMHGAQIDNIIKQAFATIESSRSLLAKETPKVEILDYEGWGADKIIIDLNS
jgi:hypothetical protein